MSRCRCWSSSATGRSKSDNAPRRLDVLAAGTSVALVFSDVVLPGQTDGLALARIVAERYPNIPVVLTTGYTKVFETSSGISGAAQAIPDLGARPRHPAVAQSAGPGQFGAGRVTGQLR